jgi:hypothetical protein
MPYALDPEAAAVFFGLAGLKTFATVWDRPTYLPVISSWFDRRGHSRSGCCLLWFG